MRKVAMQRLHTLTACKIIKKKKKEERKNSKIRETMTTIR